MLIFRTVAFVCYHTGQMFPVVVAGGVPLYKLIPPVRTSTPVEGL